MKKNRFIFGFIVCALICIGVGFAALTDTLSIGGTLSTTDASASLQITNVTSSDSDANLGSTGSNTITLSSSKFKVAGDEVTFTLTVTNKSDKDLDVKVTSASTVTNSNPTYFSVTYSGVAVDDIIDANNGTKTVTITCQLLKTPVETQTANFSFTIAGTAVEKASN